MTDVLIAAYPWLKSLHVISVIAWMAGLFYLPRIFVYHVERAGAGSETDATFKIMEDKLLRLIMNPSMIASWTFGLLLVATPGVIDWGAVWPWVKLVSIFGMTWFHMWCAARRREFADGANTRSGRSYRIMNEVPTVFLVLIVVSVIARPF